VRRSLIPLAAEAAALLEDDRLESRLQELLGDDDACGPAADDGDPI